MNELEILRVVRSERKPYWGGRKDYSYLDLRIALGVEGSWQEDLSDSLLSNLLLDRPGADESRFLRLISGPGARQAKARTAVEESLGLDGLFSCTSRSEVIALISRSDRAVSSDSTVFLESAAPEEDYGLSSAEQNAIKYLVDEIVAGDHPVFFWDVPFNSGASIVARNLWRAFGVENPFSQIAVMRPSDITAPYEAEIRKLTDGLEAKGYSVGSKRLLARAIQAENVLLVVLSPFVLDVTKDTNSMRSLVKEFLARRDIWAGASQLLLVGHSEWVSKLGISGAEIHARRLMQYLRFRGADRFVEFRNSWNRFSGLRRQIRSEESGSRMRRAATYYRTQNTDDVWPISIKLRALFASNDSTAAYFDPTQGFKRLAGTRFSEFPDIKSYVEDVNDYISYVRFIAANTDIRVNSRRKYFYLLQYASTAKHWLTEEALDVLIDKVEEQRQHHLNITTEKRRMRGWDPIVIEKTSAVSGTRRSTYFASIAIKALIQDNWINSEPYERSLAHFRIAERLKRNENDKELLDREFPYEPQWGRSRIFFLSETIRHLMRSCETFAGNDIDNPDGRGLSFPGRPKYDEKGTKPSQVINYCYEVLYQRELNGNANGKWGRALAKRYGAYQLAVELLELLSDNYVIGIPHKALRAERRIEFIRECGFALLDVGELEKAKECFERAAEELRDTDRRFDKINVTLDIALVESARGRLDIARRLISKADEEIISLHRKSIDDDARQYYAVRNLFRRVLTREAHLEFLQGNHEEALDLIDRIEREERWKELKEGDRYRREVLVPTFTRRLEAEQTHLLIASMHRRAESIDNESETQEFSLALNRCMEAMLYAESEGLHHQAMGFRIVLARCFRRMDRMDTAETILDAVHEDLLRYGCSERTFLSFLNEAGRVLAGVGDPIRAYATYLRPCIGRARARGFRREAMQAAVQAKRSMEEVRRLFERCNDQLNPDGMDWSQLLTDAIEKHRKLVSDADDYFRGGPFEKDPLFAYAVVDAEEVIISLNSHEVIARHLSEIEEVLLELQKAADRQ